METFVPEPGVGTFGGIGTHGSSHPAPCECPPDPGSERLELLQSLFERRTVYERVQDEVVFYRRRPECETARQSWEPPADDEPEEDSP